MSIFDATQDLLATALTGASARQSALAQNLANANTPNYKRVDVDFQTALSDAWSAGTTNVKAGAFTPQVDDAATMRADGNSVDLDTEASKLAENGLTYQSLVAVMNGRDDILKSAMGVA